MLNRNAIFLLFVASSFFYCLFTGFQTLPDHASLRLLEADSCRALSQLIEYEALKESGQYQDALLAIQSASELYEKHELWERHVEVLIEISAFADLLDYTTKSVYSGKALAAARAHLPGNHPFLADAYRQRGEVYTAFEQYDSSLYCYKQALPIFELHENWEEIAWTKLLQAVNYYYSGEIKTGLQILRDTFWENQTFSKDIYSSLYNLQGVFNNEIGDLSQVIISTEKALAIELASDPATLDSAFVASIYNNLGIAHYTKGDLRRAEDYYQKSSQLSQQLPGEVSLQIDNERNIGQVLMRQNATEKALTFFRNNLALLRQNPHHPAYQSKLLEVYLNLGETFRETAQYDSAYFYLSRAIKQSDKKDLADVLYQLGRYYTETNQLGLAIDNLQKAYHHIHEQQFPI